jgi:RimJ/RimL family protein N-acetyltransferase
MTDPPDEAPWYSFVVPTPIETRRLVLRAFEPSDAAQLKEAIDANLEHLQRWMPWAMAEPSPLEVIEERMKVFAATFQTGPSWGYAIRLQGEPAIIGGVGLHARIGPRALEIGYWIDQRLTRRGYATEATLAMTNLGFSFPEVDRLEIRCDPENEGSARIPRRLGFRYLTTLEKNEVSPAGEPRDTMVWELARGRWNGGTVERQTPT